MLTGADALMGRSLVRTSKTLCSRDLVFDLSILSVSFSNDLAVQTFMPSLLFWAMIGCSSKLRSAQCDGCVSLTFMSPHQPRQPPMNLLWCDPCEKTFHEDLSSNTFFLHTSSRLAWATQRRLGSWCPSLEKPMCNGTVRWLDRMLFLRLCIYSAH